MPKKNDSCSDVSRRAWNILRIAILLWARKGSVLKRRLMMELRLVPKLLKKSSLLGHATTPARDKLHYFERELSFDKTPIFNVKMHRPASMRFLIPCFAPPQVDFDYDFGGGEDEAGYDYDDINGGDDDDEQQAGSDGCVQEKFSMEEEGIDSRAEKFIAKFYEQMKLQRQISYLKYRETLNRDTTS